VSNLIKEAGNGMFRGGKIEEALTRYEEALSVFRFIEARSYENMRDEDLQYMGFEAKELPAGTRDKY
jgi:hypothetical protein